MKRYALVTGILSAGIIGYLIYDADISGIFPALFLFISMFLLLVLCLLPGYDESSTNILSDYLINKPRLYWVFLLTPAVIYLLTFVIQNQFWGVHLLNFMLYVVVPFVLVYSFRRAYLTVQHIIGLLTAAIIWIPFDHRWYKSFWPEKFPFSYEFCSLLAVLLVIYLFLIVVKQDGVGYRLVPQHKDFFYIGTLTIVVFAIIIPIGVLTGFLVFKEQIKFDSYYLFAFIGIFLSVALVEEIIFRGIIQNLLEKLLKNEYIALVIASILFGLTHWNNADPGFAIHYIALASMAGVLYGLAYRKTKSLFPAIFLHALVDTIWLALFVK